MTMGSVPRIQLLSFMSDSWSKLLNCDSESTTVHLLKRSRCTQTYIITQIADVEPGRCSCQTMSVSLSSVFNQFNFGCLSALLNNQFGFKTHQQVMPKLFSLKVVRLSLLTVQISSHLKVHKREKFFSLIFNSLLFYS